MPPRRRGGAEIMDIKEIVSRAKTFLLDLDGTVYLEGELIGDMKNTLRRIRESGREIVYLTNNSSKTKEDYAARLENIGILEAEDKTVYGISELNGKSYNNSLSFTPNLTVEGQSVSTGFQYASENTEIADIDENGVMTAKKAGEVTIVCSYEWEGRVFEVRKLVTVSVLVIERTDIRAILLKKGDVFNVSAFTDLFGDEKVIKILDETDGKNTEINIGENGVLSVHGSEFGTGDKTYCVYNERYAYSVPVFIADYVVKNATEYKEAIAAAHGADYVCIALDADVTHLGEYDTAWTNANQFNGIFNGRGYAVKNVKLNGNGFFGEIKTGSLIENTAFIDIEQTALGSGAILSTWNNGTVKNIYASGTVRGQAGFIVDNRGKVENCIVHIDWADYESAWYGHGGLYNYGGTVPASDSVKDCYGISANFVGMYPSEAWNGATANKNNFYTNTNTFLSAVEKNLSDTFGEYWSFTGDGNLLFGGQIVEAKEIELTKPANSHDLFYFSKDATKCTDYAANNISAGKYTITLFDDIAEITSLTIGGVAITDFTYDASSKTLWIAAGAISALTNGTQEMKLKTSSAVYIAQVTVADYVITTANEIDTVIPYVQRNHTGETYVVLGNDIEYTGTYTDTYNSGSETEFQYQGTFDGRGYAISGFNCSSGGMFYQLGYYGTIKNLALIGATQTSANGGILVNMCYGKLDNLYVSGTSSGNGGIVGQLGEGWGAPSGAQATNCVVNVECTHSDGWWQSNGGVFGNYMADSSTMVNCWSVSSTYQYVVKSTGTAVEYNNGSSLLSAWNGTLPEGFNGNWKLENGVLSFGNCKVVVS